MGGVVKNGHACVLRAICEVRFKMILEFCLHGGGNVELYAFFDNIYICIKVAETPESGDGFIGDLISTILVPSYALDGVNGTVFNETDYTQAQKDGVTGEGCTHYHENCQVSLFEVIQYIKINFLILHLNPNMLIEINILLTLIFF